MADNVTITSGAGSTPPAGTIVATDDVGGVQYQRVKLDVGGDGASTPVVGTLPVSGTVAVSGTVPVSAASLPLPAGAATDTLQTAQGVLLGPVTETAPASDIASSGLNGRLQRIAQRLTSLIAVLPASLGQKDSASSLAVTIANDQSAIPASQSGVWTVQPGNTANTTAWKVDGSAVTQPVSGTVTANVGTVPVTDNSGSLTVDAPVATPVYVRLSDGSAAISTLQVTQYDADLGLQAGMTALRDVLVAQRYTVLSDSIADGINPFWTQLYGNGGGVALSIGEGILTTSTSATGYAQMVSPVVPYFPGQVSWFNSAFRLGDTGGVGNVRRWGAFTVIGTTPWDGYYYELSGTTLNAVAVKAGTATAVASTSWTKVATNPFTLDTNYHQWEIRYTANSVQFLVDNILRHTASGGSTSITQTLNFPMAMQTVNSSGSTERTIAVRNVGIGRFGTPDATRTASNAVDGSSVLPQVDVMAGWDGLNVRSAWVQSLDGHNSLFTHDNLNRRILEEVLIELRLLNAQTARMLGPQALTQRDMEPLRLIS